MGITVEQFEQQIGPLSLILCRVGGVKNVRVRREDGLKELVFLVDKGTTRYETLIRWNRSYQQPVLHFRISVLGPKTTDSPESWVSSYNTALLPHHQFRITLTQLSSGNWWFVHPCDTLEILQNSPPADYLVNWSSVYLGIIVEIRVDEFHPC